MKLKTKDFMMRGIQYSVVKAAIPLVHNLQLLTRATSFEKQEIKTLVNRTIDSVTSLAAANGTLNQV